MKKISLRDGGVEEGLGLFIVNVTCFGFYIFMIVLLYYLLCSLFVRKNNNNKKKMMKKNDLFHQDWFHSFMMSSIFHRDVVCCDVQYYVGKAVIVSWWGYKHILKPYFSFCKNPFFFKLQLFQCLCCVLTVIVTVTVIITVNRPTSQKAQLLQYD